MDVSSHFLQDTINRLNLLLNENFDSGRIEIVQPIQLQNISKSKTKN